MTHFIWGKLLWGTLRKCLSNPAKLSKVSWEPGWCKGVCPAGWGELHHGSGVGWSLVAAQLCFVICSVVSQSHRGSMSHPKLWQLLETKPWMNFSRSVTPCDKFKQLNLHTFTCKWQLTFPNTTTWKNHDRWTILSGAAFAHLLSLLLCWNSR